MAMTSSRLTQSQARINEREKSSVYISAGAVQTVAPSKLREAMATMGPVLASAFCVAAIMYPLGSMKFHATISINFIQINDKTT